MRTFALLASILCLTAASARAEDDAEGCKDSPLVGRFPGAWISSCEHKDFDELEFAGKLNANHEAENIRVEGTIDHWAYGVPEGKSSLQLARNFEAALKKAGATILVGPADANYPRLVTGLFERKGQKTYVAFGVNDRDYEFSIVQPKAMEQEVEANADGLMDELGKSGHVAVYGINFDTGKASLTADSSKVLEQVAKLLADHQELKLRVEGHTDNQGKPKANLELSKKRAEAVKAWLVAHGVDAGRLTTAGLGQQKPVADNGSEAGRAKNRRVELVKL